VRRKQVKQVVWNKQPGMEQISKKSLLPRQYISDISMSPEMTEKFTPYLQKGALWQVAAGWLTTILEPTGCEPPPHPYAQGTDYQPYAWNNLIYPIYPKNTLAIYLGPTRVEEIRNDGKMISVSRHTFMINGNIFLVRHIASLEPVI